MKQSWQEPTNEVRLLGSLRRVAFENGPSALVSAPAGYGESAVGVWVDTSTDPTRKSEGVPLNLWLQKSCGQENLWFLGAEHLLWTQAYLLAGDANRRPYETNSRRQKRSWLPEWVERFENREAVLHGLEALKADI